MGNQVLNVDLDDNELAVGATARLLREAQAWWERAVGVPGTITIKHHDKWVVTVHPFLGRRNDPDARWGNGETLYEALLQLERTLRRG